MTPTHPRHRATPFVCPACRGPSRQYKGQFHGWHCSACIRRRIGLDSPKETR